MVGREGESLALHCLQSLCELCQPYGVQSTVLYSVPKRYTLDIAFATCTEQWQKEDRSNTPYSV
jgi:hypothetical protein